MVVQKNTKYKNIATYVTAILLATAAIILIALQQRVLGFSFLGASAISLLFCTQEVQRHWYLLIVSLSILGLVPINTAIDIPHMLIMGGALLMAVAIPYITTKYIYKDNLIRFRWHHGRSWYKHEIGYIIITAVVAYLLLPFYFVNTGAYLNWAVEPGWNNLGKLFIGTNALGIWDELFFIATALALLRHHTPFWFANITQAVLFTSFLYELGFTGWAPLIIYPFALLQGLIYKKTESLLYVITIHLTLDLILYLALINAHHPSWLPIFITG